MRNGSVDSPIILDESDNDNHSDCGDRKPSPARPAKRNKTSKNTCSNDNSKTNSSSCETSQSDLFEPKCPIKLFATPQTRALRAQHKSNMTSRELHWSYTQCWTLRELLGLGNNVNNNHNHTVQPIDWIVISNYFVDFDFILSEVPEVLSIPNVLVVYQYADKSRIPHWKSLVQGSPGTPPTSNVEFLLRNARQSPDSEANPFATSIPYSCHHTKLFLVGFRSKLRVVIHTSNLWRNDVHLKCQGAFVQDFPLKTPQEEFNIPGDFEETLITYLDSYKYYTKRSWQQSSTEPCSILDQIAKYNFSKAKGVLIPSIPGEHRSKKSSRMPCLGYRKVREAIRTHVPPIQTTARRNPIVCQYSSIGVVSQKYLQTLWNAWNVPSPQPKVDTTTSHLLELVYPTIQEIQASIEGIRGGESVPGRSKNVHRPHLQSLYHRWGHDTTTSTIQPPQTNLGYTNNIPHIKSYYQWTEQDAVGGTPGFLWFVLSSHNLSKAAWGEFRPGHRGETFHLLHWELGVWVSPATLGVDRMVPYATEEPDERVAQIPLPYPVRPSPFGPRDTAWTLDVRTSSSLFL